jgi:tetratricopeptide (TPR) repeat protein
MPLSELIGELRSHSSLWNALSSENEQEADAVRTVFAWSVRALPPTVARAFRLLGLHPGPDFGLGAATALLAEAPVTTRTLLDALAGAHLLEQTGPARYQFHDLLRAYAADLAAAEAPDTERTAALTRLADWYLYSADAANLAVQKLMPSVLEGRPDPEAQPMQFSDSQNAVAWYSAERVNLLALIRALADAGSDQTLWKLVVTLQTLQDVHGGSDDRLEAGRLGLEAARRLADRGIEARVLQYFGYAWKAGGQLDRSADAHRSAMELYTALGDTTGVVEATNAVGLIHLRRRELDHAADLFRRAVDLAAGRRLQQWRALATENLASTRLEQGLLRDAIHLAEQAMAAYDEENYYVEYLTTFLTLARALRENGDLHQAEDQLRAIDQIIARGVRHLGIEVDLLLERACLTLDQNQGEAALELLWQRAQLQQPLADSAREAATLTGVGQVLGALGRIVEAADFHRRAVALRRTLSNPFQLAYAEAHLADVLDELDEHIEAQALRGEALDLLSVFTDVRAVTLRERITAHVSNEA